MKELDHEDRNTVIGQIIMLILWDRFSYSLQSDLDDYLHYILPANIAFGLSFSTFFFIQYKIQKNRHAIDPCRFNGCVGFYLIGPLFSMLFCLFTPNYEGITQVTICMGMHFHSMFFAQGLFVSTYKNLIQPDLYHIQNNICYPIMIFSAIVFYGFLLPGNHSEVASEYVFPIYKGMHLNILFILGSWLSLYAILWWIKTETNKEFDEKIFKLVSESSLWCYISHTLFDNFFLTFFI